MMALISIGSTLSNCWNRLLDAASLQLVAGFILINHAIKYSLHLFLIFCVLCVVAEIEWC